MTGRTSAYLRSIAALLAIATACTACSSSSTQSVPSSTIVHYAAPCAEAEVHYRVIVKAENQLGNNSAMTPYLYANRVRAIAQASAWLADHATAMSLPERNFWKNQSLMMSDQITKAANNGTSTDELIQYSTTAQSAAFTHDEQRVINYYVAACPGFASN